MSAPASLKVSDHALVRWMERSGMVNLDPVKDAIAASLERAAAAALKLGVAEFLILADGLVYVVREGVVVTVQPQDGRHRYAYALANRAESTTDHA